MNVFLLTENVNWKCTRTVLMLKLLTYFDSCMNIYPHWAVFCSMLLWYCTVITWSIKHLPSNGTAVIIDHFYVTKCVCLPNRPVMMKVHHLEYFILWLPYESRCIARNSALNFLIYAVHFRTETWKVLLSQTCPKRTAEYQISRLQARQVTGLLMGQCHLRGTPLQIGES